LLSSGTILTPGKHGQKFDSNRTTRDKKRTDLNWFGGKVLHIENFPQ